MMPLAVDRVSAGYGSDVVIHDVSLNLEPGRLVAIIGPNGSGKSTLLRTMSRVLPPAAGRVTLDGEDIYRMPPGRVARVMAVVRQEASGEFPFRVEEMVMLGRLPHLGRFRAEGDPDRRAAGRAMQLTDTLHLRDRSFTALSGGEKQRVVIARALAQEPRILLLDEPTNHLDISYQVEILELVRDLARDEHLAVAMVLHDLNLASLYADTMLLLHRGRVLAFGSPGEVITPGAVSEAYGARVLVTPHPLEGRPQVSLVPRGAGGSPNA